MKTELIIIILLLLFISGCSTYIKLDKQMPGEVLRELKKGWK